MPLRLNACVQQAQHRQHSVIINIKACSIFQSLTLKHSTKYGATCSLLLLQSPTLQMRSLASL